MSKNRRTKKLSKEEQSEVEKLLDKQLTEYTNSLEGNSVHGLLKQIHIDIKCKSENQKKLINSIKEKEVTICDGLAGCGKTFLSCAEALKLLKNNYPTYKKIVIVKSVTTLKDEELGFLKGDLGTKLEPVMYSFTGNFKKLIGKDLFDKLKSHNLIEEMPIAYLRGVTLSDCIVIIDETQNISVENMRTIMTRIGENTKYVILGDVKQIDIKNKKNSSLERIMTKFESHDDFGIVRLGKEDIVRHRLIAIIDEVFDSIEKENLENTPKK
jgi:phosphate starvation-inducible PhoH-like protein